MTDRGPSKKATPEQVLDLMEEYSRPVWTASSIAEQLDVSRPTVQDRLEDVVENPLVQTMQVGNTKAYYLAEEDPRPIEEQHKDSIKREFEDKFVGLQTAPWTAIHPNDGPAEGGNKIQIRVRGTPDNWVELNRCSWDDRRESLGRGEIAAGETQALISGTLYERPTTPIEHVNYPDDYDLELNIGAEYKDIEDRSRPILIAAGVKNYLIKPCDDAVFLEDVSVDWISAKDDSIDTDAQTVAASSLEDLDELSFDSIDKPKGGDNNE